MATDVSIYEAVRAKGFADCVVVQQRVVPSKFDDADVLGTWHVLSVRTRYGGPYEVWGRRRTKDELLSLAKRGLVDYRKILARTPTRPVYASLQPTTQTSTEVANAH